MRINGIQQEKLQKIYQNQDQKKLDRQNGKKADRMEISERAREMNEIKAVLSEMPEVREDKVAELKEQINSDNYEVGSRELAQKIINDFSKE
ncbi:MAG: flagellar biosynthesis anti-sigma factor FlgM [Halanaerobiaceae bacterium]